MRLLSVLGFAALISGCQVVSGLTSLETKASGGAGGDAATSSSTGFEPSCGDGNVDSGEACDDGNTLDADGCSGACELECVGPGTALDPETGRCLLVVRAPLTWADAKARCESLGQGAHLATPSTLTRAAFAIEHVKPSVDNATTRTIDYISQVWLGASDTVTEGEWAWVDGTAWSYTDTMIPWVMNQPDDAQMKEDCLSFWLQYNGLNDLDCTQRQPYVCELPAFAARCGDGLVEVGEECDPPDAAGSCSATCQRDCKDPAWFELRADQCFLLTSSAPFSAASVACPEASELAILDDAVTLGRVAARVVGGRYWLDATIATGVGTWGNGTALPATTSTTTWAMGEPTASATSTCVLIETGGAPGSAGTFGLRDYACTSSYGALCSKKF